MVKAIKITKEKIKIYKYSCELCYLGNRQLTEGGVCTKCLTSGNIGKYFKRKKGD